MRVVLKAESGSRAGHRVWIGPNQQVRVGASPWAEFSVPGDPQFGEVQFVVEADSSQCRIRNLEKQHRLLVNGCVVTERTLVSGDTICAGTTRFSVVIHGRVGEQMPTWLAQRMQSSRDGLQLMYRAERSHSGLLNFSSNDATQAPTEVVRMLARQHTLCLLVHPSRLATTASFHLERATDLLKWKEVPAAELQENSVVLITPLESVDRYSLLQESWRQDAVCCLFTSQEKAPLLETLKQASLWLCPPSVIRDHLATGAPSTVVPLFDGIKGVLLEGESPCNWTLFASNEKTPVWQQFGFPNAPGSLGLSSAAPPAPRSESAPRSDSWLAGTTSSRRTA